MALNYPDIIGEYVSAPHRFEVNGLQYTGIFEPPAIATGETTQLHVYMQNVIDVPLKVMVKVGLPQAGFLRGQPVLTTGETEIELELEGAEAGRLTIPLTTTDKLAEGRHTVDLEFKVQHEKGASRIRNPRLKQMQIPLLTNWVGLGLVGVLGASYQVQNGKKASVAVTLTKGSGEAREAQGLQPNYQQMWNMELAELLHKAQVAVNTGRIKIVDELKIEPLFIALYTESIERFADTGLPLRIGEAIAIGKLLTYTTHFFLGQEALQDALLCPIWERALANEYATTNALDVIRYIGYKHIVRLAAALSFGIMAETTGKHLWPERERQEVTSYIANALDEGSSLLADFLYVPLMIGALRVITRVRLPDEDIYHTLQLIKKARQARPGVLIDDDMAEANKLFYHLLQQTMARAKKA
jgi:hypothetical protein